MANIVVSEENWQPIMGFSLYEASSAGRIRSVDRMVKGKYNNTVLKKGKILKPTINSAGYYKVGITNETGAHTCFIHRLVALAHIPPVSGANFINHKDGDKLNNKLNNLEWVTPSQNNYHASSTGLSHGRKGVAHHNAKLTDEQVLSIKEALRSQKTTSEIALFFSVSCNTIQRIASGAGWSHVGDVIPKKARTHCDAGHEFTPENTYVTGQAAGKPRRHCRACEKRRKARPVNGKPLVEGVDYVAL